MTKHRFPRRPRNGSAREPGVARREGQLFTAAEREEILVALEEHLVTHGCVRMTKFLRDLGCTWGIVCEWMRADPSVAERVRRAQLVGTWITAEECVAIADDSADDFVIDEKTGRLVLDREAVQRSKLRIEARWRLIGSVAPTIWGTKLAVQGDPNQPVHVVGMSDAERRHKILSILGIAETRPARVRVVTDGAAPDDAEPNGPVE